MATIPTGQGRRVLPGRAPAANVDPNAFGGMQTGRATERLGAIATDATVQYITDERHAQAAEAERQRQISDAAERQRDLLTMQEAQDKMRSAGEDLDSGVRDGTVPKTDAEKTWQQRSTESINEAVAQISPKNQDLARRQLGGTASTLGRGVRKSVERRDQQDIRSGIDQTLEYQSRQYAADPAKATQMAMDTISQLGPFSGWGPDELNRKGQAWKETAQFTRAYGAITAGRNDHNGLNSAEELVQASPDLDPQKKETLLRDIEANRIRLDQKAEMAAARQQRIAETHLRRAEAAWNTFQGLADKGTAMDPTYMNQVMVQTAGTPYQAGVVEMARRAKEAGGIAAQPIKVQQQALDDVNTLIAQQGRSEALDKRKDQIEKVLRGSQQDLDKDGLRAGLERGVITEIPPLDFSRGLASINDQLQLRLPLAQRVGTWAGRPVSVLNSNEAEVLGQQLSSLSPRERAGMINGIATVIGPQASQALTQQLNAKDNGMALAFAYAGKQTTQGRLVSELILRGQQAKADGTSTKGDKQPDIKAARWRADLADELREVYPSQAQADQALNAAVYITHAIASEQGGELRPADRTRAAGMAAGGAIVDLNGRKIPTPFLSADAESKVERRLRSVSTQELSTQAPGGNVIAGGVPMPLTDFVESLPGQQLIYAGPGRYGVLVGGRPVKNTAGNIITIGIQ